MPKLHLLTLQKTNFFLNKHMGEQLVLTINYLLNQPNKNRLNFNKASLFNKIPIL